MTAKKHYDHHLARFYSWMTGDLSTKTAGFKEFLAGHSIMPSTTGMAIDLGAGHGIQSIPLAEQGFRVIAVDFNDTLLSELKSNAGNLDITVVNADIRDLRQFSEGAELVVCCGDTLTHLDSRREIQTLIADIAALLDDNGKLVLSFRDYSTPLSGTRRFIPVRADETRILTCVLDYETDHVNVTDLLYEKTGGAWQPQVSEYKKVRLSTEEVVDYLSGAGLVVSFRQVIHGMTTIIAGKGAQPTAGNYFVKKPGEATSEDGL